MKSSDRSYLAYVASLGCIHCGQDAQAHHIIGIGDGRIGGKAEHAHTMPLCVTCHAEVHKCPSDWPQAKWLIKTQQRAIADGRLVIK